MPNTPAENELKPGNTVRTRAGQPMRFIRVVASHPNTAICERQSGERVNFFLKDLELAENKMTTSAASQENRLYGWFDDVGQATPTYDPPHDTLCPYCAKGLTQDDVRTHSLMYLGTYATRSYFYRTHRTCDNRAKPKNMDNYVFEMIAWNGD